MSEKPVNLNKVRKARARKAARAKADQNAAYFGMTKSQKTAQGAENKRRVTKLDQHRRDVSGDKKSPE